MGFPLRAVLGFNLFYVTGSVIAAATLLGLIIGHLVAGLGFCHSKKYFCLNSGKNSNN